MLLLLPLLAAFLLMVTGITHQFRGWLASLMVNPRRRRTVIGVAVVATDKGHCVEVLDACERLVASRPEVELLSARQQFVSEEDD